MPQQKNSLLLGAATKAMMEQLRNLDPDFIDCYAVVITLTAKDGVFDMVCNCPDILIDLLEAAIDHANNTDSHEMEKPS